MGAYIVGQRPSDEPLAAHEAEQLYDVHAYEANDNSNRTL